MQSWIQLIASFLDACETELSAPAHWISIPCVFVLMGPVFISSSHLSCDMQQSLLAVHAVWSDSATSFSLENLGPTCLYCCSMGLSTVFFRIPNSQLRSPEDFERRGPSFPSSQKKLFWLFLFRIEFQGAQLLE